MLLIVILLIPFQAMALEVLQISGPDLIQVGDNNRNYKVKLACLEIDHEREEEATSFLKEKLPRHSKINLRPKGSEEGVLVASVISRINDKDISQEMAFKGYADFTC